MKLADFKDKYKGYRAFFIGNGPSIKETPLHLMKDEYCFGTNRVCQLYEHTDWRPTHYIAVTGNNMRMKDWFVDMMKAVDSGIPCFLTKWYYMFHNEALYYPPRRENIFPINTKKYLDKEGKALIAWSKDASDKVFQSRTVSMSFLQLAYWMGFNPLYLVGCDMGYKSFEKDKPDPSHWMEDYEVERSEEDAIRENTNMIRLHAGMAMLAPMVGAKVYNATIGGELETYPRVDIYEVLNE